MLVLIEIRNRKWYRVHRLVAQAFIPNPENKRTVNHKNWIRDDNRVENLERDTYSEQERHSRDVLWKTTKPPDSTKYNITYNWITDSIRWWSKKLWIIYDNILWRLHKWRPIEKVLWDKSYRWKNYWNKLFNK